METLDVLPWLAMAQVRKMAVRGAAEPKSRAEAVGKNMSGWIGVDLDGTLAVYHGWNGTGDIGEPVKLMLNRVKKWLAEGREVRIFTARVALDADLSETTRIQDWTLKHLGVRLPVTCCKDYGMIELWDDRCVQVEPNTGKVRGVL